MSLSELQQLVETLRQKSQKHRTQLQQSEALTRYALIDPVLRALGWDTENPDSVHPEYAVGGGAADYALLGGNHVQVFVEAKALGKDLSQGVDQGVNRCLHEGVSYFVVTDGIKYEVYDTHKAVPLPQKRIAAFDLTAGDAKEAVLKLMALWSPGHVPAQPIISQAPNTQSVGPGASSNPLAAQQPTIPVPQTPMDANQPKWVSLSSLDHIPPHSPVPSRIRFPDGSTRPLKYWKDLLLAIVWWLDEKKTLGPQQCPVQLAGSKKRYLVHSTPKHPDGKPFGTKEQVGPLWVEFGYWTASYRVWQVKKLLEQLGQSPDSIMVSG